MGIRACAKSDPAFSRLYDVYLHREEETRRIREHGTKIVAKLGFDVPDELILAAGMQPVQVFAEPEKPLVKTDTYLEFAFDPLVRKQFERIVDGTYADRADYLAVSNSTDVIIRVFLYLREMKRIDIERIPPITFLDLLFTRNRMHQERNELIVSLFRRQLEEWRGSEITDEEIRSAMCLCNENRAALRTISELRRAEKPRITGSEALVIIGAGFYMDRAEHTELVRAVAAAAQSWPEAEGMRVYVTGSAQEDTSLYELIEAHGMVVVSEDHDWGDRSYERDCNTAYPVLRGIVDRYMLREYSSKKAFVSQRVDALQREVRNAGAQAVIFYSNIYEESPSWDYPSQKKMLDAEGVPSANFVKMQYPVSANPDLESGIADFAEARKEVQNG